MKIKAIVLGSLFVHCLLYSMASSECPLYANPNDYIDNPNTLDNGLFECGDPNLTMYGFTAPIYWERLPVPDTLADCYAALHSNFVPPESRIDWNIPYPYQGDTFVVLSTGGFGNVPDRSLKSSTISQKVFLQAGDIIIGAYFFGTTDYWPYDDYASIYLELAADPNDYPDSLEHFLIPEAQCSVDTTGSFKSTLELSPNTGGWITFSHTVELNQVGPYFLRCEVVDVLDTIYNTYFSIDGLRICRGDRPIADLDWDCDVDLVDFSILSSAWMADCNEISNPDSPYYDSNIPCQLADIDNSWLVDLNDLIIMSDQWFITTSE